MTVTTPSVEKPIDTVAIKAAIKTEALRIGFDEVGFASAAAPSEWRSHLSQFLSEDRHGEMAWLEASAGRRSDPQTLWPEAKSIIVLGLNYGSADDPLKLLEAPERGAISVYARGRDYHDVLKSRLKQLARWIHEHFQSEVKVFVDTAPVMEKPLAMRAGVGWQGKHTNLVSREFGSWLFLGEVFTSLELPPDDREADYCGQCQRCLDVCPTRAFSAPYRIDARRCISYLTIEHKGMIAREFRAAMGNRIYGCDDCLAVCPWNKFARQTSELAFQPRIELTAPRLLDLVTLDDAAFREVFSGSPIKRIGRDRFIRNVLIALGNSSDAEAVPKIEPLLEDPSAVVRAAAIWALSQLAVPEHFEELRERHLPTEQEPMVISEWSEYTLQR